MYIYPERCRFRQQALQLALSLYVPRCSVRVGFASTTASGKAPPLYNTKMHVTTEAEGFGDASGLTLSFI